ncbi:Hpt domain-containing protein [Belnapia rosea]|uniref:Hpt domain-containing protein n=1 Tax=Belnapia rosea TaxID=938405 RepID=A0A1G6S0M1_9PROT|nr:Hpt domain-containing protein [Belnapia rosea]
MKDIVALPSSSRLTQNDKNATRCGVSAIDPNIAEQLAQDLPPADFRRIIETFEDDLGRLAHQLEAAAIAGNWDNYQRAAHSLAGAAAAVGAIPLEQAARVAMDPQSPHPPAVVVPVIRDRAMAALQELSALVARSPGR